MNRDQRVRRRDARDRSKALAFVFIGLPVVAVIVDADRYSLVQWLFMPVVGLLMLLWFRFRPAPPEHVVAVEFIYPEGDYDGPDARTEPFYAGMCDCGWISDDHQDLESARRESLEHTPHVLEGQRKWGD